MTDLRAKAEAASYGYVGLSSSGREQMAEKEQLFKEACTPQAVIALLDRIAVLEGALKQVAEASISECYSGGAHISAGYKATARAAINDKVDG